MARFQAFLAFLLHTLLYIFTVGAYDTLTDDSLRGIPGPGNDFDIKNGAILAPILIPRVSGTEGSTKVLNHLADFFRKNLPKWNVSFQNSTQKTPASGAGETPFINLIVTRDPPWAKTGEVSYFTLAAHYDSKMTPEGFIGATDSAAPCAMIMHAARALDSSLTKKWADMEKKDSGALDEESQRGVQLLLFDGEEALETWTATDSIYGARSLAEEWENTFHPALSTFRNPLQSISLFVLLDLLGAKAPVVPSYFITTHWAYAHMAHLESRLRKLGLFKSSPNHATKAKKAEEAAKKKGKEYKKRAEPVWLREENKKDSDNWLGGLIGDDHEPFLHRGVEVLHMIPSPFPRVWHEMDDNGFHLDMDTVEDWTLLVTAFTAEWMELEGFMDKKQGKRSVDKEEL